MTARGDSKTFSANEASCITDVPLKEVHRIIDAELLGATAQGGGRARTVHEHGLLGLRFAYETKGDLTPGLRRRLLQVLLDRPDENPIRERCISVDIDAMDEKVREGRRRLAIACKMVSCDDAVLSGTPCIAGTRIPAHDIADMRANGDSVQAIVEAYPQLTVDRVELAALYARAYPRRGRPRRKPFWRDRKPEATVVVETALADPAHVR
ncbi:MAG: DUF433 domain-containing protein [Alphaproteobacteria bacterium]|nr:DUF433 domain-containing protein [Alphaproteobacteria bacterium]